MGHQLTTQETNARLEDRLARIRAVVGRPKIHRKGAVVSLALTWPKTGPFSNDNRYPLRVVQIENPADFHLLLDDAQLDGIPLTMNAVSELIDFFSKSHSESAAIAVLQFNERSWALDPALKQSSWFSWKSQAVCHFLVFSASSAGFRARLVMAENPESAQKTANSAWRAEKQENSTASFCVRKEDMPLLVDRLARVLDGENPQLIWPLSTDEEIAAARAAVMAVLERNAEALSETD